MGPPLAGRPPFATDEPDSIYETPQPTRRIRQPPPPDPNKRTSAYNMYDNYLNDTKRTSGMGALGMGFLNGSMDDDDDDDDVDLTKPPLSTESRQAGPLPSKHAALAAATREPSPPPQYIASPRPGYAAPIAALTNLARPEPAQTPQLRQPPVQVTINTNVPPAQNPFLSPSEHAHTPVPSTPHPLQAPMTPITPVFARPQKQEITFANEKPILRGNRDSTLLPKRGERGDDFWRRFSVIAHNEGTRKSSSSWLRKTQNGTNRMSRWVFIIGLILTICAAGGIGLGWYISHNSTSNNAPTAVGGSAENAASGSSSSSVRVAGSASVTLETSLHVSPTLTVARRDDEPVTTGVPTKRHPSHRRRNHEEVY